MFHLNKNLTKEKWEECYKEIQSAYADGWVHTLENGRTCYGSFAAIKSNIPNKLLNELVDSVKIFKEDMSDDWHGYDIYSMGHLIHYGRMKFEDGYKELYYKYIEKCNIERFDDIIDELISKLDANYGIYIDYSNKICNKELIRCAYSINAIRNFVSKFKKKE